MKRCLVLICLLAAACGPSRSAQSGPAAGTGAPTVITPLMLEPPPIYALLGFRDRLTLTSPQITALDSIATSVQEANSALMDELRDKATPTRGQVGLVVGEEQRPLLQRIRDNNRRAAQGVGEVLNPTQREAICRLFQEQQEERRDELRDARRDRDRMRRAGRRNTEGADTTFMMERSVWPWCTPAPATPTRR